jgi:hypothetical protein
MWVSRSRSLTCRSWGRAAGLLAGAFGGVVGGLMVAPLARAVCLRGLRAAHPELFDGAAAGRQIRAAVRAVSDEEALAAVGREGVWSA